MCGCIGHFCDQSWTGREHALVSTGNAGEAGVLLSMGVNTDLRSAVPLLHPWGAGFFVVEPVTEGPELRPWERVQGWWTVVMQPPF